MAEEYLALLEEVAEADFEISAYLTEDGLAVGYLVEEAFVVVEHLVEEDFKEL